MKRVRRRQVLYIPGFDPSPPRVYRERYRREGARQAEISGFTLSQSARGPNGWDVTARIEDTDVSAQIDVLVWSDIVRARMSGGIATTYLTLVRTAWSYIGSGALWRLMRLRKGPVIAALYPVAVLLGQAALAGAIWAGAATAFWLATEMALAAIEGPAWERPIDDLQTAAMLRFWVGVLVIGPGLAWLFLRRCARRDRLYAWYLMKDYAFSSSLRGAYPPEQEARMRDFAEEITNALQSDVDEVLVVGHSSGAYLAVSVLADVLRGGQGGTPGPTLSLLTLGHVIPMVSFLPHAHRLRADLAYLSTADIAWVDVTAPADGCAFGLCDPVAVSGVAASGKRGPLVISAAFSDTLSEQSKKALKWHFFETHFQYLNAFDALPDRADAYDYFRVTAGPMTLADRFATRPPSPSRIETPVNRYIDTVP